MGLYDPGSRMAMANTAEELGRRYEIGREASDEFGYRSHVNAKKARDAGWFDEEIEPVSVRADGSDRPWSCATTPTSWTTPARQKMARLRAAFEPGGVITAGNASAVVDGAAAMVIGKEEDAEKHGLKPLARVVGMGVAACDPEIMGWGPVPAVRQGPGAIGHQGPGRRHRGAERSLRPAGAGLHPRLRGKWASTPRRSIRWAARSHSATRWAPRVRSSR